MQKEAKGLFVVRVPKPVITMEVFDDIDFDSSSRHNKEK
jgi:hypothetical protein